MLSQKNVLVIVHAKEKSCTQELQHHPAAAGMAAEISKTKRPPCTTAKFTRENTGTLNAHSAAAGPEGSTLPHEHFQGKKKAAKQSP